MSLSIRYKTIIQLISERPRVSGKALSELSPMPAVIDRNQLANDLRQLEKLEYIQFDGGWYLAEKGEEVMKYGA